LIGSAAAGDTITFAPSLNGQTITLTSGELVIAKTLTVAGPGANLLTVSGHHASRVFHVEAATATVSGLTIADGSTTDNGGGLRMDGGQLTVNNCTVRADSAPNGGAIHAGNGATLTIGNSAFAGNTARLGNGGGINLNDGTVTISNSTFAGNTAPYYGGGIYLESGTLTIGNSTLAGNSARYGGGMFSNEMFTARNTIVAGNSGGDVMGSLSGDHNLIGGDPKLGSLQDNGGPTPTRAPLPGSTALGQGDSHNAPSTDQRGQLRVVNGAMDIGAMEHQDHTVSTTADAGPGSLRQAVADAGQGESVLFAAGVTGHTITLVSGELLPRNGVSVTGPGADLVTVSGAHSSRVFEIPAAATVTIAGLTITHGWADTSGGGILNHGTLTVSNCLLTGNDAKLFGGAIANPDGGILQVIASTLKGNTGGNEAGGLENQNGVVTLVNTTVNGNQASPRASGAA
jgi:predicted outer membrane repeat protein